MAGGPRHYDHVLRVAALFGVGFVAFLIVRSILLPHDFGLYGFFRAGALDDVRARPTSFAGEATCVECHNTVADERKAGKHAQVRCEACHGPLAKHATGQMDTLPAKPDGHTLCLTCHTKLAGRPDFMPQIVAADHFGDDCTACHKPHHPKIE